MEALREGLTEALLESLRAEHLETARVLAHLERAVQESGKLLVE